MSIENREYSWSYLKILLLLKWEKKKSRIPAIDLGLSMEIYDNLDKNSDYNISFPLISRIVYDNIKW